MKNRKKITALLLCLLFPLMLFAGCGDETPDAGTQTASSDTVSEPSSDSDTDRESTKTTIEYLDPSEEFGPNLVIAHNSLTDVLGVYDMSLLEPGDPLEDGLIWYRKGIGDGGDLKYREDTVFGDVILALGSADGASVISYPEGKILWKTLEPGNNPHAIEILPSGNIIVANSTGSTLRLFSTSALVSDPNAKVTYVEYELQDAHGVLYDPAYEVVWALGGLELAAYKINGSGAKETLSKISGMGVMLPSQNAGGHDLSADYTSEDHLYLTTNSKVFRFDKENNELIEKFPQYAKLSRNAVKGFSNNPNGNFFFSRVNNGVGTTWEGEKFASWCTDRIHFCYMKTENFMYVQEYVSENGAFYKVRAFCGTYL